MQDENIEKTDYNEFVPHFIYVIRHMGDGKIYIGYSKNTYHRWATHKSSSRSKKPSQYIHKAMKKHGVENFVFEIIEEYPTKTQCKEAEIFYIEYFKFLGQKLYNVSIGGEGGAGIKLSVETKEKLRLASMGNKYRLGIPHSEESIEKIRAASKNQKLQSAEARERTRQANIGRKHTEEAKRKMSVANSGRPVSTETRQKMSNSHRGNKSNLGKKFSIETREKMSKSRIGFKHTEDAKNKVRGSKNASSKLNEAQVIEIYNLREQCTNKTKLGRKYGVGETTISRIFSGRTWNHITKDLK